MKNNFKGLQSNLGVMAHKEMDIERTTYLKLNGKKGEKSGRMWKPGTLIHMLSSALKEAKEGPWK